MLSKVSLNVFVENGTTHGHRFGEAFFYMMYPGRSHSTSSAGSSASAFLLLKEDRRSDEETND